MYMKEPMVLCRPDHVQIASFPVHSMERTGLCQAVTLNATMWLLKN